MTKKKEAKDIEVHPEVVQPKVKTKEFTLRAEYMGKSKGDTVILGVKGEQFYKSKNLI